jgi:hypothetical protein
MGVGPWIVAGLVTALPLALLFLVLWRSPYLRMHVGLWLATLGAAAALFVPVFLVQRLLQGWAEIDPVAATGGQITLLLYGFFVVAPLEMATITLAVFPFWRLRRIRMRAGLSRKIETQEGVFFALSAALGFATMRNLAYLWLHGSDWASPGRAALRLSTFVLLCAFWGYVLGRNARRGMGGRRFSTSVLVATLFSAVVDQLVFRPGTIALMAVLPLLASMLLVAFVLWRNERGPQASSGGALSSIFTSAPVPSIQAIREAFRQHDRPLTLRWISFGALVTAGMITSGVAVAVLLGHELGVDFSAVDRADAGPDTMAPLMLLGLGALSAFPSSGYLLARASGTRSVLEPAMASAVALVLMMVFLGMVAPVSIVFVIAFAPIAFALSCAGAWVGLGS